jgi:Protein of unknown function (DUF4232)
MTRSPDDQLDPYEPRLTRRVGEFAEQAVRPFDAAAIAAAAHAGARRRTLASRVFGPNVSMARLGTVLAGALVAAAAFGMYLNAGASVGPDQTSDAHGTTSMATAEPTPTGAPGAAEDCSGAALTGQILAWEGAAGHRIATISIRNRGATECALPGQLHLALIDSGGQELINGVPCAACAPFGLPAGAEATTLVDMANFCGTSAPTGALKIRIDLPAGTSFELSAAPTLTNPLDPPPCNGPSLPGTISMQALRLTP